MRRRGERTRRQSVGEGGGDMKGREYSKDTIAVRAPPPTSVTCVSGKTVRQGLGVVQRVTLKPCLKSKEEFSQRMFCLWLFFLCEASNKDCV